MTCGNAGNWLNDLTAGLCSTSTLDTLWCASMGNTKIITFLDSILKGKYMILLTKVHLKKAVIFSIVMYGC